MTPQTGASKLSYEAVSRPITDTSSSFDIKQTINESSVRAASAEQGMFFDHETAYGKYPDLQARVDELVFGNRDSKMRDESVKKIHAWRAENATKDKKTYFAGLIPQLLKSARKVATKKRTFAEEIVSQAQAFTDDGLDRREDCLFVKNIMPLRTEYAEAAQQGVTTPKPDFVYGLKRSRHPSLVGPPLDIEAKNLIGVAPEIRHPFFSIDNKGSQHSIEAAENQSMRSGATMVAANRALKRKAKRNLELIRPKDDAADSSTVVTDTAIVNDATASDTSFIAADGTVNTIPPAPQANVIKQENLGADFDSFTFTCSWVPQMANIHVHWYERRPNETHIYHMNLVRGYLMSDKGHLTEFRKDIYNILDWGIALKRKTMLEELEKEIAEHGGR